MLSRRTKNNPVLIGEAGVGKTAIVEGIAQRIVDGDVPDTLAGRRVVELQLFGVVAGARYRGDFEKRLRALIDEIRAHSDELIVFIDELRSCGLSDRYETHHQVRYTDEALRAAVELSDRYVTDRFLPTRPST